jgi:hypothetical protein
VNRDLYFPENVNIDLLYFGTRDVHACRNEVDVALDSVGSGLLDLLGIVGPTAQGCTVEAGDDRNVHCVFGFPNVIQIAVGSGAEFAGLGKVGERLGKALRSGVEMVFKLKALLM